MLICSHQKRRFLNQEKPNVFLEQKLITPVEKDRFLGVILDQNLLMDEHINSIHSKVSKLSGLLWRIGNCLDFKSKILFYNSYVQPTFDYCCTVWGTCSHVHINKLTRIQIRFGRIIIGDCNLSHLEVLTRLKWLSVEERIHYNTLVLVFKSINNLAPEKLQNLFHTVEERHNYALRNAEISLNLPKPRTEALKRSFQYFGASLWNKLPCNIRRTDNLNSFKIQVKEHITSSRS